MADQTIQFVIRADTAQGKSAIEGFTKSLAQTGAQSQKTLSSFRAMEQQANESWAANRQQILLLAAAVAGATVGLIAIVKETAEYAEQMEVAAQKTGMGVEQLQAFRFAAEQSEVSFEAVMIGAKFLSKAFSGLAEAKGAAEALTALKITAKDTTGGMRPLHDLLMDIADKFQQMRDGPEKAALAVALFSRSGTELIPVLNMGRAGILALEKQAHDLGIVLNTETARAAAELADEFTLLEKTFTGLKFSIARELIPTFSNLLLQLVALGQVGLPSISQGLRDLAGGMYIIAAATNPVTAALFMFNKAFREQVFATGLAIAGNQKQTEDMTARILEMRRVLSLPGAKGGAPPAFDLEAESAKKAAEAIDQYAAALERFRKIFVEVRPELDATDKAWQRYLDTLLAITFVQDPLRNAELRRLNTLRLTKESAEAATEAIQKINEVGVVPPLGKEVIGVLSQLPPVLNESQLRMLDLTNAAASFGKQMSGAFTQMVIYGKGFSDVMKSLLVLIAEAIIKAYVFKSIGDSLGASKGFLGVIGSFFGGLGGAFQSGGRPPTNAVSLVGERGPELFIPDRPGTIAPISGGGRTGGSSSVINNYIDARGADAAVEYRVMRALQAVEARAAASARQQMQQAALRS